jgi:dissimilatory sulfite reductase (desulfoviridin) alpha/beta subunit
MRLVVVREVEMIGLMIWICGVLGAMMGTMVILLKEVKRMREELKEVKRIVVWMQKTEEEIVEEWM